MRVSRGWCQALVSVSCVFCGVPCWIVVLRPLASLVSLVFGVVFFACVLRVFRDCERAKVSQSESDRVRVESVRVSQRSERISVSQSGSDWVSVSQCEPVRVRVSQRESV